MSLTHILIDFENVRPEAEDLRLIRGTNFRIHIFHGAHQNKFDAAMVKTLQPLGSSVEYIQCERAGSNALDFRIAFALGGLVRDSASVDSSKTAKPAFLVISKDGDLDTILEHLQSLGYVARRTVNIQDALGLEKTDPVPQAPKPAAPPKKKPTPAKPVAGPDPKATQAKKAASATGASRSPAASESWDRVLSNLRDHPNNRPTTVIALERHLKTALGKESSEKAVKDLSARLQKEGVAVLVGKKLEYKLP